jgi:hypothetical protein
MKIPPRITFGGEFLVESYGCSDELSRTITLAVQVFSILVASGSQIAAKKALTTFIPDLCSPDQKSLLVCPISSVLFEASVIW